MKFNGMPNYFRRKKKMVILNSKVSEILPELMDRNLKLADRLQNKLKVSSFFNSIEQRNKNYLQNFIFSSIKRTKDLKTGVQFDEAIKQSSKMMSVLINQMDDDIFLKNMEKLIKEKKLVLEKTEQETHIKIEELLNNLRNAIKKPKVVKQEVDSKIEKSYTEEDKFYRENLFEFYRNKYYYSSIFSFSQRKICMDNMNEIQILLSKKFFQYCDNYGIRNNFFEINNYIIKIKKLFNI